MVLLVLRARQLELRERVVPDPARPRHRVPVVPDQEPLLLPAQVALALEPLHLPQARAPVVVVGEAEPSR